MAELDLQRKQGGGLSWLWWIIGLIVIGLIIWWLASAFGHSNNATAATVPDTTAAAMTSPATAAAATTAGAVATVGSTAANTVNGAAPITTLAMLMNVGDTTGIVGRQVQLTNAKVGSVVSDRGFWVTDPQTPSNRLFVIRTNQASPATPPNGAINAGQTVDIYGTVQAMPANLTQQTTAWNLRSTDAAALNGHRIYVAADSTHIVAR